MQNKYNFKCHISPLSCKSPLRTVSYRVILLNLSNSGFKGKFPSYNFLLSNTLKINTCRAFLCYYWITALVGLLQNYNFECHISPLSCKSSLITVSYRAILFIARHWTDVYSFNSTLLLQFVANFMPEHYRGIYDPSGKATLVPRLSLPRVPSPSRRLWGKRGNLFSQYDIFFFQTYITTSWGLVGREMLWPIGDCFHSFFEFSQTFTQMDCAVPRKYKICKTTLHENHRFAFGSACWISSKLSEQLGIGNWSIRETIRD